MKQTLHAIYHPNEDCSSLWKYSQQLIWFIPDTYIQIVYLTALFATFVCDSSINIPWLQSFPVPLPYLDEMTSFMGAPLRGWTNKLLRGEEWTGSAKAEVAGGENP